MPSDEQFLKKRGVEASCHSPNAESEA